MSKYTTEVRYICETAAGLDESAGYTRIDDIVTTAAPAVFDFQFPIFDEAYRLTLEKKILKHYYTREICEETVGLWKLRLEDRLNMIMPYYNKLYDSTLYNFNPLYDVDVTTTHTRENESEEASTELGTNNRIATDSQTKEQNFAESENDVHSRNRSIGKETEIYENTHAVNDGTSQSEESYSGETGTETDTTHWKLYSDTPQGGINGIDGIGEVNTNYFLTNATKDTDDSESTTTDEHTNSKNEAVNSSETSQFKSNSEENTSDDEMSNRNRAKKNSGSESSEGKIDENANYSKKGNTNITNTEDYIERVVGKHGYMTYSKMLIEFRDTILNIDQMIIDALSDLFFGLWA